VGTPTARKVKTLYMAGRWEHGGDQVRGWTPRFDKSPWVGLEIDGKSWKIMDNNEQL